MKTDVEQIPAYLFEWIQEHPFAKLGSQQQQEVLLYFTQEEYIELHEASQLMSAHYSKQSRGDIKAGLLNRFDTLYPPSKLQLRRSDFIVWKVAATFLLFGCVGLSYLLMRPQNNQRVSLQTPHTDTIYIEQLSAPLKIYDTVYIASPPSGKKIQPHYVLQQSQSNGFNEIPPQTDVYINTIRDINKEQNSIRHSSIKDDSLINNYPFVTL